MLGNGTANSNPLFLLQNNMVLGAILLALPFVVLYWLVPAFSSLTLGNDYPIFPIKHQLALMYSVENGSFPLYAPGFAMGQSATALTLGQIYHPLSHIASWLPGYWDGDALSINTLLRLLSLGICQWVLFTALRQLQLSGFLSFILSFITVYNLRMLDMFRYGASLENYSAFIMLCAFALLLAVTFKKRYFVGVVVSSYLITVGGHPQIAYIGFISAAALVLMSPFFLAHIQSTVVQPKVLLHYWLMMLLATVLGILIAAPYVFGFYFDFLPYNDLRTDTTYEWSTAYQDNWGGTFRSFYAPLDSNVHGVFGGSALVAMFLVFPVAALIYKKAKPVVWGLVVLFWVAFLAASGDSTPVHRWVWEYLPMASNFRTPGRFSLMVLFPILLVLVWLFTLDDKSAAKHFLAGKLKSKTAAICLMSIVLLVILKVVVDHFLPGATWPQPSDINDVTDGIKTRGFLLGLVLLLCVCAYFELLARKHAFAPYAAALVLVVLLLESTNALRFGTWVTENKPQQTSAQYIASFQEKLEMPAEPGIGLSMGLVDERIKRSIIEPNLARFYRTVYAYDNPAQAEAKLTGGLKATEAVVLADPSLSIVENESDVIDTIELTRFSYNQLAFEVTAAEPGLLSVNQPYRKNWGVVVNGEMAPLHQAQGFDMAVFLPEGTHQVVFKYQSAETLLGMQISVGVVILLLIVLASQARKMPVRLVLLSLCLLPAMVYLWWEGSLHTGEKLDIEYRWSSQDFPSNDNLAYGKPTRATSNYDIVMPYLYYSGRAVDGQRDGRRFTTGFADKPRWALDLGAVKEISTIAVYKPLSRSLPITVWLSPDNKTFRPLTKISSPTNEAMIELPSTISARYVVLRSEAKNNVLGFTEVEVLGPN